MWHDSIWWSWKVQILLERCQRPVWGCGNQIWYRLTCAASLQGSWSKPSPWAGHGNNLTRICCGPQFRKLCYLLDKVDVPASGVICSEEEEYQQYTCKKISTEKVNIMHLKMVLFCMCWGFSYFVLFGVFVCVCVFLPFFFFWFVFYPKLNQTWVSDEDEPFQLLHVFYFKEHDVFTPKKHMLFTCHLSFG